MKRTIKKELETYTELHWWNGGAKTLSHKGTLKDLLESHSIKHSKRKTEHEHVFKFRFKSIHGITFEQTGLISDFTLLAKQAIQMELVRMGDKSKLYVANCWRSTVTVNH